jgi:serine/threonine protein kinase
MGAGASKDALTNTDGTTEKEDDDDNCKCFFIHPPTRTKRSDTLGTPLPQQFHRKRATIPETLPPPTREVRGRESSRYGGLEVSIGGSGCASNNIYTNGTAFDNGLPAAIVHEGENAELELQEKYEIQQVLGVGSTSTCHKCTCRATNLPYACKIIDKLHIDEKFQGMMQQFHVEIDALRKLDHPSIIQLYDVYITGDKIFIIMELMEGGELFDYVVQKGTLTEEEASKIVKSVTSAMVYMHSKNIIHRDLKPENLLLKQKPGRSGNLDVKIIDFGLSKLMEEPVARSFLGTRGYLAPEMLQRRDYSRAVDTWALGVIVFVLLCGCLPFDDDSQTVPSDELVRSKFVLRFPRWAKNLSPSAKDLLAHLLEVDPNKRYSAEQAYKHPWVQGETASKKNYLESPRLIRKSPRTPQAMAQQRRAAAAAAAATGTPGRSKNKVVNHVSSFTPRTIVRKTSI